jgi:hypothetical protein
VIFEAWFLFCDARFLSRVPLSATPLLRLKLLRACDQWHSSRVSTHTLSPVDAVNSVKTLKVDAAPTGAKAAAAGRSSGGGGGGSGVSSKEKRTTTTRSIRAGKWKRTTLTSPQIFPLVRAAGYGSDDSASSTSTTGLSMDDQMRQHSHLNLARDREVRCAFSGINLHSRMLLSFTPLLRLKRLHACGQCRSSRVSTHTLLPVDAVNCLHSLDAVNCLHSLDTVNCLHSLDTVNCLHSQQRYWAPPLLHRRSKTVQRWRRYQGTIMAAQRWHETKTS